MPNIVILKIIQIISKILAFVKCKAHKSLKETVLETICYRQHHPRRRWGIFIHVNDLRAAVSFVRKRGDTQAARDYERN